MQALVPSDLNTLDQRQPAQSVLKRIRDHHHLLAILFAQGKKSGEIAALVGMSLSRISILRNDPAMQELVEAYRSKALEKEIDLLQQITQLQLGNEYLALEAINERLADGEQVDQISLRDLVEIHGQMADRNGRTKVSRSESVSWNGKDLADGLAEARRRREVLLSASAPSPSEQRQPDAERPGSGNSPPAEHPTPAGEVK